MADWTEEGGGVDGVHTLLSGPTPPIPGATAPLNPFLPKPPPELAATLLAIPDHRVALQRKEIWYTPSRGWTAPGHLGSQYSLDMSGIHSVTLPSPGEMGDFVGPLLNRRTGVTSMAPRNGEGDFNPTSSPYDADHPESADLPPPPLHLDPTAHLRIRRLSRAQPRHQ